MAAPGESLHRTHKLKAVCREFERAWLAGHPPSLEEVLARHGDLDQEEWLRELWLIKASTRRRHHWHILSRVRHVALGTRWFSRTPLIALVLWCVFLPASSVCHAHPEGFSGMHVTVQRGVVRVVLTVHTRDMGRWFPPGKHPDYVRDVTAAMAREANEIVEVRIDETPLPMVAANAFLKEVGLIELDVDFRLPSKTESYELLIWSKHLIYLPRGHQQLVYIEDRRESDSEHQGVLRLEDVLTVDQDAAAAWMPAVEPVEAASTRTATIASAGKSSPSAVPLDGTKQATAPHRRPKRSTHTSRSGPSRISFFALGVEHILVGYDHLLFLAALLLACTTFRQAASTVTCFTVAHSITLALAALDIVRLPASIVEPAIALSIVYVAAENLFFRPTQWRRSAITFGFGLIHGLGFASVLRDLGLGRLPGGIVWPLLTFNLGVEAGQLAVAAVILPVIFWSRRSEPLTRRLVPVGSVLVATVGGYWFVTRVASGFLQG